MNESKSTNVKLSFGERFCYGIGDYAGNLVYSAISAFLLVYYTNVVGASAAAAASIIAVSKIFDGISDLVMGYIIDHTHSKWGKARPWIARLCVPLAVCTVLMFSVPSGFANKTQIAYMFLTYNLVSTIFYTGTNIAYATMNGLMTTNQYERGLLGNFRMLLATAGTMTVNTVVLKMTSAFGGGDAYSQKGWTLTFAVLMIVYVVLSFIMFAVCKERVGIQTGENIENAVKQVSFMKGVKGLVTNKYWVLLVVCMFSMFFMMSCFYGSAVYYAQYKLGDPNYFTPISNYLSMAQIVTMFITPFIMKKLSKRNTFLIGMSLAVIAFGISGFAANIAAVKVLSVIKGISVGFASATMFGMLQDAITYGEWKNGFNNAGMGNAASSFCMKIGSGVGTAVLGWILAAGKFDAKLAVQPASALNAINWAFAWIPAIMLAIAVLCLVLYDLDKKYDKVVEELAVGHYKDRDNS